MDSSPDTAASMTVPMSNLVLDLAREERLRETMAGTKHVVFDVRICSLLILVIIY